MDYALQISVTLKCLCVSRIPLLSFYCKKKFRKGYNKEM
jgi:hypothetical protein